MTIPLIGTFSVSGFANAWLLLFFVVIVALVAIYAMALRKRRRHVLRFANFELLQQVSQRRPPTAGDMCPRRCSWRRSRC